MILGTFNGAKILAFPSTLGIVDVAAPAEIEWDEYNVVSTSTNPFTGVTDIFDWLAGWWTATLSFASMDRESADYWSAWISELRGPVNTFQLYNPKATAPKGAIALVTAGNVSNNQLPANAPLVNGSGQTGYGLNIKGLSPNTSNLLLPGDLIQVGYRAYKNLDVVNADSSGNATISIWPNLRTSATESITDGTPVITSYPAGLFRLAKANGNKYSVTATALYGMGAIAIREAL